MPKAKEGTQYALVKTAQREIVLRALWENGKGPRRRIEDKSGSGRATILLHELTGLDSYSGSNFSTLLKPMEALGLIKRDHRRVKRTDWIELGEEIPTGWLPEWDEFRKQEIAGISSPAIAEIEKVEPKELEAPEKAELEPATLDPDKINYDELAVALLGKAIEAASMDATHFHVQIKQLETRLEEARQRLFDAQERYTKLKVQNDTLKDDVRVLTHERDGLRRRNQDLQRIVDAINDPRNRRTPEQIVGEVRGKQLRKFISEKPRVPVHPNGRS